MSPVPSTPPEDVKAAALRTNHALHRHPERITDPDFLAGAPFLDPRDLVQVKYEMLRRVRRDGLPVNRAAAAFGFSRPIFYQSAAAFDASGLPGLLPQKPGPRRRHKLTQEVMTVLQQLLAAEPGLTATELARRLRDRLGLSVHPRSIERGLARQAKKGRRPQDARDPETPP